MKSKPGRYTTNGAAATARSCVGKDARKLRLGDDHEIDTLADVQRGSVKGIKKGLIYRCQSCAAGASGAGLRRAGS
jgi:hypothetical protein